MNTGTVEHPSLKPIDDGTPRYSGALDASQGGWNLDRLTQMVADCENQPFWRRRADVSAAYVDGKQFTPEQEAAAAAEGLRNARPTNLIGRVIRSVCGQEAKARTDVKVESDEDDEADLCDVFNVRLKEAQRECYADMAVSEAYFGQVGPGIGWVEVATNADPLDYRYRVKAIHRSEMWWDWKGTDFLLDEARWLARKRWQDLDELQAAMPQHKDLLKQVSNGWAGFTFDNTGDEATISRQYADGRRWENYQRRAEWLDTSRKRVKLYEIWYKVPALAAVLQLSPTRKVLFDRANQAHIQAAASGTVPITRELTRQVRMSLFAGPHRLSDVATTRRNFPYVPFIAYRDDEDLSPYGLVEGMISPQDEYNSRRLRINWMLQARQIVVDNDALDTEANSLAEIADRVMRPDLVVVTNPNRVRENGFRVGQDMQLQKEQIDVMQDAKQLMQDVPGIYGSQLGQAASGVTSGIANSLLIEQGAVSMGDLNDNYRHARRRVFENLLDRIIDDHRRANLPVKIGRGSARRVIALNAWDPQQMTMQNSVADAATRVGLGEVPATPAYRMQQQQQIAGIIAALGQSSPQAVAVLAPSFIEATDLPDRAERADDLRRATGMPTAGDRKAAQQQQAQQAEDAAKQKQVAEISQQLQLEEMHAKVMKTKSDAGLNAAKVIEMGHKMGLEHVPEAEDPAAAAQVQAHQAAAQASQAAAQKDQMIAEAIAEAKQMMAA